MQPQTNTPSPLVPITIIIGFFVVALAIFFSSNHTKSTVTTPSNQLPATNNSSFRLVDETDNIRGNPNATIMLVEYSDYECPFCKQYHSIMRQVIDEYGATGRIAWVYRQFPVPQLHPNAPKISEAALCVSELGGNEAFWKFSDTVFDSRGLQDVVTITKLPEFAEVAGVNRSDFTRCLESGRKREAVENSMREAYEAGVRVTPYTVVMVGNEVDVVEGAISYEILKGIVEDLLAQLDGAFIPATSTPSEVQ